MRKLILVLLLVIGVAPSRASVVSTGDVDPGGAATQSDPWIIDGDLKVGDSGDGTLVVEASGEVSRSAPAKSFLRVTATRVTPPKASPPVHLLLDRTGGNGEDARRDRVGFSSLSARATSSILRRSEPRQSTGRGTEAICSGTVPVTAGQGRVARLR